MSESRKSERDLREAGVSSSTLSKLRNGQRSGRDPTTLIRITQALAEPGGEPAVLEALLQAAGFGVPWAHRGRPRQRGARQYDGADGLQVLDPRLVQVGRRENFYVLIRQLPNVSAARFTRQVIESPLIVSAFEVLGEVDAVLKVAARNVEEATTVVDKACSGLDVVRQILSPRHVYWDWSLLRTAEPIELATSVEPRAVNESDPRLAWLQVAAPGMTPADIRYLFDGRSEVEDLATVGGHESCDVMMLVKYQSLTSLRDFIRYLLQRNKGGRNFVRATTTMLVVSLVKYQPLTVAGARSV